eukprot:2127610-Pyramimonas_sp.AAC.1
MQRPSWLPAFARSAKPLSTETACLRMPPGAPRPPPTQPGGRGRSRSTRRLASSSHVQRVAGADLL